MSFDNIRVRLITLSLIIIMPLFAVLTLPPTYHVEVAAFQVGMVPKQNQPFGLLPFFYAKAHVKEMVCHFGCRSGLLPNQRNGSLTYLSVCHVCKRQTFIRKYEGRHIKTLTALSVYHVGKCQPHSR